MLCTRCGHKDAQDANFCPRCGARIGDPAHSPKSDAYVAPIPTPPFARTPKRTSGRRLFPIGTGRLWEGSLTAFLAAALLVAPTDLYPNGYYNLLRLVVTVGAAYWVVKVYQTPLRGWVWIFAAISLLMNPFVPIRMDRLAWQPVDVTLGIVFLGWSAYWTFLKARRTPLQVVSEERPATGQTVQASHEPLPDFGKHLTNLGTPQRAMPFFPGWEIGFIDMLGHGEYSTNQVIGLNGKRFSAVFWFGVDVLDQILIRAQPSTRLWVNRSLERDPNSCRRLTLRSSISVGIAVVLGTLQQGTDESFIPLVIHSVFGPDASPELAALNEDNPLGPEPNEIHTVYNSGIGDIEAEHREHGKAIERYQLNSRDRSVVDAGIVLLKKVANSKIITAEQRISVLQLLHILSTLPETSSEKVISMIVNGPQRGFGQIRVSQHWEIAVEGRWVNILSGGYFYRPTTGGDSFTSMDWSAAPAEPADFHDYRNSLRTVPGLSAFPESVAAIDIDSGGYSLEICDGEDASIEDDTEAVGGPNKDGAQMPNQRRNIGEKESPAPPAEPPPAMIDAGFASPEEQAEAGRPYWRSGETIIGHENRLRTARFTYAHNPEGEVRAWAIHNQNNCKGFAAYKTPSGDVVVLYIV
jgi:hypothetical protein